MFNTIVGTGAVGAGAASRYGSGSGSSYDQKMRLLAAPAPALQHCSWIFGTKFFLIETVQVLAFLVITETGSAEC
jgi:hypothetical protein